MSGFEEYRTALITGATSGIGRATTLKLRERGLDVVAIGRSRQLLDELAQECGAIPLRADVRDTKALMAAIEQHQIDVLINNAGILSSRATFQEIEAAEIDAMIDVNLKAPMQLSRLILPGMVARRRGHLIFLGSSGGLAPYPLMGAYGASKAGLSMFSDNLRLDLLGTSVRVTEVAPGRVQTNLYQSAMGVEQSRTALYDGYRAMQPEHVAELIAAVIALPTSVNVARIEVFPTDQATGGGTIVKHEPPQ